LLQLIIEEEEDVWTGENGLPLSVYSGECR
jgi:hypothetical protein